MKPRVASLLIAALGLSMITGTSVAAPRLMQGTPAQGEPYTAQLIVLGTTNYEMCSAAIWKPRVLLTAAHCLTDSGSGTPAASSRIFVMPPGVNSPLVYASGPVGAARVRVLNAYLGQNYVEASKLVVGNDIAAVVLDTDLVSTSPFTRLADRTEIERWAKAQRETQIVGYGITSLTDTAPAIPRSGTFLLSEIQVERRATNGWVTWSNPVNGVDTCPGDSGAPQFVTSEASTLLIGDIAGGNCNAQPRTAEGFAAITYLEVLNPALTAAGYPPIPSAPQNIIATSMNGKTTVWWATPRLAADYATNYEVRNAEGKAVCTSTQPYCTVDSTDQLTVRSINSQNEGDAATAPSATPIRPRPPTAIAGKTTVKIALQPLNYPVVTGYRVLDQRRKVICRISRTTPPLTCTTKLSPGSFRFTVSAATPQGRTPESGLSNLVVTRS
ncbi:MAG: trypsin-like serine protease [Candidatus Nanopelagicales bacterium]|nr:trypsin-like serine protease [Candidatus Nanopelagicales bacterium]MDD2819114.1 trypsin-like serine protease [Candidatus Nanopelagicales bacterium]